MNIVLNSSMIKFKRKNGNHSASLFDVQRLLVALKVITFSYVD